MILTRTPRVDLLEPSMKRRLCENRIMTEYHTRKPYFINENDDLVPARSQSSAPSDEIWNKFELYLTPPSSPLRENNDDTSPMVQDSTDSTMSEIDFDAMGIDFNDTEFSQDTMNLYDDIIYQEELACECLISAQRKLIKDCMWNGVGHKATMSSRNPRNRKQSPASHSPCHANGCVDPRNIFPYPVGQSNCCENQRRKTTTVTSQRHSRPVVDGSETPSDSEEEIDVVTVDKIQNTQTLKSKNTTSTGQKVIATLVPRRNGELTLLTTSGGAAMYKGLKPAVDNTENERGRTRSKFQVFGTNVQNIPSRTVTMVMEKSKQQRQQQQQQQQQQQKEQIATATTKRRHTVEETCCDTTDKQPIMQMANPKLVMQRGDSVSPVLRFGGKRRILSLDGVSFCATNRQYNTEYSRPKDAPRMSAFTVPKREPVSTASPDVTITSIPLIMENFTVKEEGTIVHPRVITSPQSKRKRKAEVLSVIQSSGSGSDSEQIRAAHNVLERQRREGLRAAFNTLRDNVPDLKAMEKTPKVNILNKARDYCIDLQKIESSLLKEKERLLRRQQRLKSRLELARKSVHVRCPMESDIESEGEDSIISGESPMSSLPPSPNVFIPNRYYVTNGRLSKNEACQELVLRLETSAETRKLLGSERKRHTEYPSAVKQVKCQTDLRALIASLQKSENTNVRLSFKTNEVMSDGYECLDSEEEQLVPIY